MKISLNHLNNLFKFNEINLNQLVENLSLSSCEIESVDFNKYDDNSVDTILDIVSTANRSDLLSYMGIAREISALIKKDRINLDLNIDNTLIPDKIIIFNNQECLAKITGIITNIQNYQSPLWLQKVLSVSGINISGDINDTVNYIMLETGFPLVLFKYNNEEDDKEIYNYINRNNIIITKDTDKLILKGILLYPQSIRKLSKKVNVKNEITQRYERGLTLNDLEYAYKRSMYLIKEIHGASFNHVSLYRTDKISKNIKPILVNVNNIINKLGLINSIKKQIDHITIVNILKSLGFYVSQSGDMLEVTVPYYRQYDILREIDLVEEIGRIYGFNKFTGLIPRIRPYSELTCQEILFRKMRSRLKILGFNEFINYSLNSELDTEMRGSIQSIQLKNPLTGDFSNLRQTLLYSIISNISYNLKMGNGLINGYEIGRLFNCNFDVYSEQSFLSLVISGDTFSNNLYNNHQNIDWFYAKGIVEELFSGFSDQIIWKKNEEGLNNIYKNVFHSYNFSNLFINENFLGIFGQLHPKILKEKNIKYKVYALEINTEMLLSYYEKNVRKNILYKQYSLYPYITRDITLNVNKTVMAREIKEKILKNTDSILTKVEIISLYEGDRVNINYKNISFRLYYQAANRTLTLPEVDNVHKKISEQLNLEFA